jgi:transcriptional regulator with XRE-family HTH domain
MNLGDNRDVGKRIQTIRKSKNLKVTEGAKRAYISQSYLSDIEKAGRPRSLDKLQTICNALEILLADFLSVMHLNSLRIYCSYWKILNG